MRHAKGLTLVTLSLLCCCLAQSSGTVGPICADDGPRHLRPKTINSIRIGMTRARVEAILGEPDYSPVDGQYYFSTPGDCEMVPGVAAGCGYIIDYRDFSKDPVRDTGRVTGCSWGGIGE